MEIDEKTRQENAERIAEEYLSSLQDLTWNSKPLINVLTILAEENIEYASVIVNVVQKHIAKVAPDHKLPLLYLIDSILKNVKCKYVTLFSQCIISIFCGVFEVVNEKIRERMYALRQTWNTVFTQAKLYALDVKVKLLDANWPITAPPPQPSIHVNPNFLKQNVPMEEILQTKTRELLELKKRKLELELQATIKNLEEQQKKEEHENVLPSPSGAAGAGAEASSSKAAEHVQSHKMGSSFGAGSGQARGNHSGSMRPGSNSFHPNFRHNRHQNFQQPPSQQQQQQQQHQQQTANQLPTQSTQNAFPMPGSSSSNNGIKAKVSPVNQAMISSLRIRDPRIAKRQQKHEDVLKSTAPTLPDNSHSTMGRSEDKNSGESSSSSSRSYHGSSRSKNETQDRKTGSPSKNSSHRSSSSRSSSKNSVSSRSSGDNRDRSKRSDSKSSSTERSRKPSSETGASSSFKSDKKTSDGASGTNSSSYKRKSISPNRSPTKPSSSSKDSSSKRSSKSRTTSSSSSSRSNNGRHNSSRSPSPSATIGAKNNKDGNAILLISPSSSSEKRRKVSGGSSDIDKDDLAKPATSSSYSLMSAAAAAAAASSIAKDLAKQISTSTETPATATAAATATATDTLSAMRGGVAGGAIVAKETTTPHSSLADSSSNVSFNINNNNNNLNMNMNSNNNENSSSNPAAASSSSSSLSSSSLRRVSNNNNNSNSNRDLVDERKSMNDDEETSKKIHEIDENEDEESDDGPMAKKSKTSNQLEILFGEEDVDFRSVAPPPPIISSNSKIQSWDNLKATKTGGNLKKNSSFEDIRAKLAKATKLNRPDKFDKGNRAALLNNGLLLDGNVNEDSMEANEEKVRTIISQAQEMLETNSMDTEQYKSLVQTVMCINETNKLKEAQRRESLNVQKPATPTVIQNNYNNNYSQGHNNHKNSDNRNAAKEAILKKRIPKIPKKLNNEDNSKGISNGGNSSPFLNEASNSPLYEDRHDEDNNNGNAGGMGKPLMNKPSARDRRNKSSKWSDRFEAPTPSVNLNMNAMNNFGPSRPWMNNNMQNKRGGGVGGPNNFRPNGPNQPIPSLLNQPMMRMGWPNNNNNNGNNNNGFGGGPGGPNNMMGPNNNNMNNFIPPMGGNGGPGPGPGPIMPHHGPQGGPPPSLMNMPANINGPQIPKPCNSIDNPQAEMVRTITIDGTAKEIRIYDKIAIVFMDLDQPREIGFQNGQRSIFIDNQEAITLRFNEDFKPFQINGKIHRFKFGFPSRELYIDEHWYEIYFGGSAVSIPIGNRQHIIKAEGPPPQVNIGPLRRDLVVGKINMIVDAHTVIPLFLDARVQKYRLNDGSNHTVQFADKLLTILLDNEPYQVEYGGLPKSYKLFGKKYFIRFSSLPKGVEPGKVNIQDMLFVKLTPPPSPMELDDDEDEPRKTNKNPRNDNGEDDEVPPPPTINKPLESEILTKIPSSKNEMPLPLLGSSSSLLPMPNLSTTGASSSTAAPSVLPAAALKNLNIDELFQKLVSSGILNSALPVAPVITPTTSNLLPTNPMDPLASSSSSLTATESPSLINKSEANTNASSLPAAAELPSNDSSTATAAGAAALASPQKPIEPIVKIDLSKPETIKVRQNAIVATLYSGMQCSSCGVRFPPEQTMKYSQHLDWHFRQNRRERDATRKAHYRKWYYDLSDWIQYEEIEDLDEREKNFFEAQQNDMETMDENSQQRSLNSPIPSCPAGPDDVDRHCDMCQEKFEQFYNEELEEWHLKSAIRVDNRIYHPLCYEDYKASLLPPKESESMDVEKGKGKGKLDDSLMAEDDNAMDIVIKADDNQLNQSEAEKTHVTIQDDDDDDDDVIVLPNEEPSVTEIVDDDDEDAVCLAPGQNTDDVNNANAENKEVESHNNPKPDAPNNNNNGNGANESKKDEATEAKEANEPKENVAETEAGTENENGKGKPLNETLEDDVQIQEPHIPFTDLDNYVEKELPELDENTQMSFLNVKIKEEPKDDYEEDDDGFEDVGTVLLEPEEISLHSSEGTQTQTISSTANSPLPAVSERPGSSLSQPADENELQTDGLTSEGLALISEGISTATLTSILNAAGSVSEANITDNGVGSAVANETPTPNLDLNASMDGDFETSYSEHNLSAAGPAPAIPIANLVNKIKINISKNTTSSSSSSTSASTSASAASNHTTAAPPVTSSLATNASPISTITNISNIVNMNNINSKHHIPNNNNNNSLNNPTINMGNNINILTNSGILSSSTSSLNHHNAGNLSSSSAGGYKQFEYSTIPVLCSSGNNNMNRFVSQAQAPMMQNMMQPITSMASNSMNHQMPMSMPLPNITTRSLINTNPSNGAPPANISAISVIGSSYGGNSSTMNSNSNPMSRIPNLTQSSTSSNALNKRKVPTPPPSSTHASHHHNPSTLNSNHSTPSTLSTTATAAASSSSSVEESITYELKPALKEAKLKKMKKIEQGIETSGLCSIM